MKCHTNVTDHNFLIEVKFNGNSEEKEQNKFITWGKCDLNQTYREEFFLWGGGGGGAGWGWMGGGYKSKPIPIPYERRKTYCKDIL